MKKKNQNVVNFTSNNKENHQNGVKIWLKVEKIERKLPRFSNAFKKSKTRGQIDRNFEQN